MSSAFSDQPEPRERGPIGLIIMAFMGLGMLAGILFLSWLGTPIIVPAVGQPLAKLELTPIAFTDKELSEEDLQGKVTVLHFWGTWCPYCLTEFPEFTKMAKELEQEAGIQVLSVASSEGPEYDVSKLADEIKSYLKEQGVEMPTYADPRRFDSRSSHHAPPRQLYAIPLHVCTGQRGHRARHLDWLQSWQHGTSQAESPLAAIVHTGIVFCHSIYLSDPSLTKD